MFVLVCNKLGPSFMLKLKQVLRCRPKIEALNEDP